MSKRKSVLVPLAFGFEEIEAVSVIDVLRRAGLRVVVAGVEETTVTGSRRLRLVADVSIEDTADDLFDAVVLPGGMPGTENLARSGAVRRHVVRTLEREGWVGAICAAPTILEEMGLLAGREATSHPVVRGRLLSAIYREDPVVVSPPVITSRGPGTAVAFALKLAELLTDESQARALCEAMIADS